MPNKEQKPHTLYTAGYQGIPLSRLVDTAQALDAVVADIRYQPYSANREYHRKNLTNVLGDRYRWIQKLGNIHYKGDGPITLAAPDQGVVELVRMLSSRPVILLCMCADYRRCHRSKAAQLIVDACGCSVEHLTLESDPNPDQLPLPCTNGDQ